MWASNMNYRSSILNSTMFPLLFQFRKNFFCRISNYFFFSFWIVTDQTLLRRLLNNVTAITRMRSIRIVWSGDWARSISRIRPVRSNSLWAAIQATFSPSMSLSSRTNPTATFKYFLFSIVFKKLFWKFSLQTNFNNLCVLMFFRNSFQYRKLLFR